MSYLSEQKVLFDKLREHARLAEFAVDGRIAGPLNKNAREELRHVIAAMKGLADLYGITTGERDHVSADQRRIINAILNRRTKTKKLVARDHPELMDALLPGWNL